MTKQQYVEMCEMLGDPINDADLPYELEDFPVEAQQALEAYHLLKDEWDTMGGNYLGKQLIGVRDILEIVGIEEQEISFSIRLIRLFDSIRADIINKKTPKPAS